MTLALSRRAEIVVAAAALVGLAALLLAAHVRHGGFYYDDWGNAAAYHFEGWWRAGVFKWRHGIPGRPILAFLLPLPYALFGLDPSYHLAAAGVLAALTSLSFFAFLRTLGIEFPHALAMAALSLIFPWADAAHLWATGAINNVAVMAYFLGSILALRALTLWHDRRRDAIMLHLLAAALYLVSVLTYEVAAAAIVLSGLLYRTRVSWRALRVRWLVDAVLVLATLGISLRVMSRVRHVGSLHDRLMDVPHFVGQGLSLFASIFVPEGISSSWAASWNVSSSAAGKLVVLAAASAVVAAAVALRGRRRDQDLQRWLYLGAGGAIAVAAAYFMFLGSGLLPLFFPGLEDRINTFAAFGFVVAAYSVLVLAARLIGGRRRRAQAVILIAGLLFIGFGFIERVRQDVSHYDSAASEQRYFLKRLHSALPRPPRGSTIFTFGYPSETAPGVPIFKYPFDGAADLLWNDRSLSAVPVYGKSVSCGPSQVRALAFGADFAAAYGRVVFVDVPSGRVRRIRTPDACAEARTHFRPGPVLGA
jgi:hypothetical protein